MAYKSKDGKRRFDNPEMGHAYDRTHGPADSGHMPVARRNPLKPDGMPGEPIGEHEGPEPGEKEPSIESVVGQHGPAHTTEIHANMGHDGMAGGGSHHVISHHQSGHVHESHGHDLHSAHMHSHKAMGGDGSMGHAEPDGDEGAGIEAMPAVEEGE